MTEPKRDLDELRDAIGLAVSPTEKIGFLILGVTMGYFVPGVMSQFVLHLVGSGPSTRTTVLVLLGAYLLCLPVIWLFWGRRRYLAIGIMIPVLVQVVIYAATFALWFMARGGVRLP